MKEISHQTARLVGTVDFDRVGNLGRKNPQIGIPRTGHGSDQTAGITVVCRHPRSRHGNVVHFYISPLKNPQMAERTADARIGTQCRRGNLRSAEIEFCIAVNIARYASDIGKTGR